MPELVQSVRAARLLPEGMGVSGAGLGLGFQPLEQRFQTV